MAAANPYNFVRAFREYGVKGTFTKLWQWRTIKFGRLIGTDAIGEHDDDAQTPVHCSPSYSSRTRRRGAPKDVVGCTLGWRPPSLPASIDPLAMHALPQATSTTKTTWTTRMVRPGASERRPCRGRPGSHGFCRCRPPLRRPEPLD